MRARFISWSLRAKITTLLVASVALPLGIVMVAKISPDKAVFTGVAIVMAVAAELLLAELILKRSATPSNASALSVGGDFPTRLEHDYIYESVQSGDTVGSATVRIATTENTSEHPRDERELRNQATELAQVSKSMRTSEARLAGIVNSAVDAIISVDAEENIVLFNVSAEGMFRCSAEAAIGKRIDTFIPEPFRERHRRHVTEFGETGVTPRSLGALNGLRLDGEEFPIEASISQIEVAGQRIFTVIMRDITERNRIDEEVRRLNEELERRLSELQAVNTELEAFSYSVSHDLRAPLRHINGFSLALLEDYEDKLDDVGKRYLQDVRSASQEMALLIDEVLLLARVTRSGMHREAVDLSRVAQEVIAELQKAEPGRDVTIDIEEGLSAYGDKRLLRVMLVNLLGNAWKFTSKREQAHIAFGQKRGAEDNSYFVRDNGAGFDMAYANKLFGTFQRLHTAREFEGTGVGLATVLRVVHRHGGTVWADGVVNEGAAFYFTLPPLKESNNGEESDLTSGRQPWR